jgi:hypothetical protein
MKFVDTGMYYAMPKTLYLISKSKMLHIQGTLTPNSMTEKTHHKEAKYSMLCGMHMFEGNPAD